jgi:hypothetical protein
MPGRLVALIVAGLVVVGCACGVGGFALGALVANHHSVVDERRGPMVGPYGGRQNPFYGGPPGHVRQRPPSPQPSAS